jgi:hypothetical protein
VPKACGTSRVQSSRQDGKACSTATAIFPEYFLWQLLIEYCGHDWPSRSSLAISIPSAHPFVQRRGETHTKIRTAFWIAPPIKPEIVCSPIPVHCRHRNSHQHLQGSISYHFHVQIHARGDTIYPLATRKGGATSIPNDFLSLIWQLIEFFIAATKSDSSAPLPFI